MKINTIEIERWVKKHIWGPIGSCIVHVVIVGALLCFAGANATVVDVSPTIDIIVEPVTAKLDEIPKPEIKPEIKPIDEIDNRNLPIGKEKVETTIDMPFEENNGAGVGNNTDGGIGNSKTSLIEAFQIDNNNSPYKLKNLSGGPTKEGSGRGKRIKTKTGTSSETAVLRALRWLKANQNPDGSWKSVDQTSAPAMAGLVLLCYLAHDERLDSVEFGETIKKSITYIISTQGSDGFFGTGKNAYVHGICTYAMSEAYGLTKVMMVKEAMDKGIAIIIDGQQTNGGYDYGYKSGPRWDLSVSGWQYQALKAAKLAGCSNENLDGAIEKGISFLEKVAHQSGQGFGYDNPNSTLSMTGAGVLCLQLLGKYDSQAVKDGVKWLDNTKHKDMDVIWDSAEGAKNPVYAWYYITQAKYQIGKTDWKQWELKYVKSLAKSQIIAGPLGHWEGGDHGVKECKVYTTTLCCLMLEVDYKFLPTFKTELPTEVTKKPNDDITFSTL